MKKLTQFLMAVVFALVAITMTVPSSSAQAQPSTQTKDVFDMTFSHYITWDFSPFLFENLVAKWSKKYGITIRLSEPMDYAESITQFGLGKYDAVTITNIDSYIAPAFGGIDVEFIVIQDYSADNDGIVTKSGKTMSDMKGREITIVQNTVTQHLVARCLELAKMKLTDIIMKGAGSESEVLTAFVTNDDPKTTVGTWNPNLLKLRQEKHANMVCGSSQIPGEIMDGILVRVDADERLKKALTGAYYEMISQLATKGAARNKVVAAGAKSAGCTVPEFEQQMKTTHLFMSPKEALDFMTAPGFKALIQTVQRIAFEAKLYEPKSVGQVGIELPNGEILGDKSNVRMHFPLKYMKMAADGKL